ncbi:hypothetical protein [Baekduia sp. Peel2402]|uniref:hypothetical protein n=1 Tax=Baekduia sp. Peel2402 TaxID=3458296 RepID=UPI00403E7903
MTAASSRITWLGALICTAGLTLIALGTWVLTDEAVGIASGDSGATPAFSGITVQEVPDRTAVALGLALAAIGAVTLTAAALRPRR